MSSLSSPFCNFSKLFSCRRSGQKKTRGGSGRGVLHGEAVHHRGHLASAGERVIRAIEPVLAVRLAHHPIGMAVGVGRDVADFFGVQHLCFLLASLYSLIIAHCGRFVKRFLCTKGRKFRLFGREF